MKTEALCYTLDHYDINLAYKTKLIIIYCTFLNVDASYMTV